MTTKLRNTIIFRPLFLIYGWIMETFGLFQLKANIKRRLLFKRLIREDEQRKRNINQCILEMPDGLLASATKDNEFVVSITSYAKRVSDTLPYALYSLLIQSQLPYKIVVYLDWDNWNDDNLPTILKKLQRVGVEFRYCEDLRSYKKLIPALQDFPNNPIITMDDDFYYNKEYIGWMLQAYNKSDKKTIFGQWGCIPEKRNGRYIPYNEWRDCKYGSIDSPISFFGCCCCYPPHIFDDEILKKELFMTMCPTADDIWFWAMEERLCIKRAYIVPQGHGYNRSVNRIEEYDWNQRGTLMYQNVTQGKNNQQLRAVLDYYHLEDENL